MKYIIGRSTKKEVKAAVKEATATLSNPKLVLFFSGVDQFPELTKEMKHAFPDAIVMGATTFVGLCKEGAYKDTLLVLGITEGIECYADVLEEVDRYPLKYVKRVEACVNQLKDYKNTLCLEFSSALISSEELILSTLNSVLMKKEIPLLGDQLEIVEWQSVLWYHLMERYVKILVFLSLLKILEGTYVFTERIFIDQQNTYLLLRR